MESLLTLTSAVFDGLVWANLVCQERNLRKQVWTTFWESLTVKKGRKMGKLLPCDSIWLLKEADQDQKSIIDYWDLFFFFNLLLLLVNLNSGFTVKIYGIIIETKEFVPFPQLFDCSWVSTFKVFLLHVQCICVYNIILELFLNGGMLNVT